MDPNRKKGLLITVIVLILIVAAAAAWWFNYGPGGRAGESAREIAPGETLFTAADGKVVSNFPRGFILEENPKILDSKRFQYSEGDLNQPSVSYESRWNMAENIAAFRDYLRENGWAIARAADPQTDGATTFYAAAKDNDEVIITLSQDIEGQVTVNIAYTDR